MKIFQNISELQSWRRGQTSKYVGFVPTMGALHEGHLSLVRASQQQNDITIVSIFVNPLQFSPSEDFSNYPRTWDRDRQLLKAEGVDAVFLPSDADMYPEPRITTVAVESAFSSRACGAFRPRHFDGVATVVLKLFNIVKPTEAYFGLKDYQQFILIKRLVSDFNLSVSVVGLPTVREPDGLAMSSRNKNLSAEDRVLAPAIYKTMTLIKDQLLVIQSQGGRFNSAEAFDTFSLALAKISPQFHVQYLQVYDKAFNPIKTLILGDGIMVAAVYLGGVRLIDNIEF